MKLNWPLKGIGQTPGIYFTQYFGMNMRDYSQFKLKGHNGIDIVCPQGTPIYAPCNGRLEFFPDKDGYGNNARIYFDDGEKVWDLVFGHLLKFEGLPRMVFEGEVIGYADSTGYSTGSHLHFGLRFYKNGEIINKNNGYLGYVDPMPFMKILVPKWIGYSHSKQKDFYLPLPDMETYKGILNNTIKLTDVYQFEDYEKDSGLDKPVI